MTALRKSQSAAIAAEFGRQLSRRALTTREEQAKQELLEESFTSLNKVRFASVSLHGRAEQLATLRDAFHNHAQSREGVELVAIEGLSGMGKTRLAETLKQESIVKRKAGLFVSGKHEINTKQEPLVGVSQCCQAICQSILELDEASLLQAREGLRDSLHPKEIYYLAKIMPLITKVADLDELDQSESIKQFQETRARFNHCLKTFLNLISSTVFETLVMVLDDVQRCDMATLEFLKYLCASSCRAMVILVYRSNEVDDNHPISRTLREINIASNCQACNHPGMGDSDDGCSVMTRSRNSIGRSRSSMGNRSGRSSLNSLSRARLSWSRSSVQDEHSGSLSLGLSSHQATYKNNSMGNLSSRSAALTRFTTISVDRLTELDTLRILMELLAYDDQDDQIFALAEVCHRRTSGNPFFIQAFVHMLKQEGLLSYHIGLFEWQFNLEEINQLATATGNVVELIGDKMRHVGRDSNLAHLLVVAACLGASFDYSVLSLVWPDCVVCDPSGEKRGGGCGCDLMALLKVAVAEGFLDKAGTVAGPRKKGVLRYVWIHDTIQVAALGLMEDEELCKLKFKLGNLLLKTREAKEQDIDVFMIANLLNEGGEGLKEKGSDVAIRVAEVNREAAKLAISIAAFESALIYTKKGLELLPDDKWTSHKDLALRLHTFAAELEVYFGDLDSMKANCDEVLKQPGLSIGEQIPAYEVLIDHMTSIEQHQEAFELSSSVLRKLGVKLPKSRSSQLMFAVRDILKLRTKLKSLDAKELASMPLVSKGDHFDMVHMFARVASSAYFSGEKALMAYCCCQSTKLQLAHGITDQKKGQIITTGMLLINMLGDYRTAHKVAEDCLEATSIANARNMESANLMMANIFIFPWTKPLRSTLKPLLRGYSVGLEGGDVENALWCIFSHLCGRLEAGSNLLHLESDYDSYKKQMNGLNRDMAHETTSSGHSLVLYLLGEIDKPSLDADPDENIFTSAVKAYTKSRLHAIFGEFEKGATHAQKTHALIKRSINGTANEIFFTTSSGLSCWAVARKTRRSSDIRLAKKYSKQINEWAAKENPNVLHYKALFAAEEAAMKGKKDVAELLFQKAFAIASRSGCIHEAALMRERHANFLLLDMHDRLGARSCLQEAQRLYEEWGALRKVEHLDEEIAKTTSLPLERSQRSSFMMLKPLSRRMSSSNFSRFSFSSKQSV